MVCSRVVLSVLLLITVAAAQTWALEELSAGAIELSGSEGTRAEMSDADSTSPASPGNTGSSGPLTAIPDAPSAMPADETGMAEPSAGSWWNSLGEMIGLTDPDEGETVRPTDSRMALSDADYIIGPGDVIGISVWRDDSLTRTVVVLQDGKIAFPLLGELVAGGKSVSMLKREMEAGLRRYISDTNLTVEVKQSNSMIVYIIGRVNSPGRQVLVDSTNVLQALAMAGGMNPYARKSRVKIYRQEKGKTAMFSFNYDEVLEGRHLETNILLKRGDVIIVP